MANIINISTAGQITKFLFDYRAGNPVVQASGGTQGALVLDVGRTVGTHTAGSTLYQSAGVAWDGSTVFYFTLVNGGTSWVEPIRLTEIRDVYWTSLDGTGVGICSGTCKDDAASALNGATVTITKGAFSKSATSAAGVYSIADIPADSGYALTVAKTGYTTASYTVEITENATTTQNVVAARNGSMSGTVTDETGNVEGATVNLCAIDTTTPVLYTATTIADGTYAIASVAVGTYDVWFSKANHVTAKTDDQAVVANTDKVVNKVLLEYGTLTGAITAAPDPEGALVELYTVYPGTPAYSGAAGALPGGTYTIANIAPGTYQIKASLGGYVTRLLPDYVIAGDDDLTLNIELTAI